MPTAKLSGFYFARNTIYESRLLCNHYLTLFDDQALRRAVEECMGGGRPGGQARAGLYPLCGGHWGDRPVGPRLAGGN